MANFFVDALERAQERGCKPDKWVLNGHITSALVRLQHNNAGTHFDLVSIDAEGMTILGLPVQKSFKIEPMTVVLAQGKKGLSSFTIPMVLDLSELQIST